jgi:hypothetical protein
VVLLPSGFQQTFPSSTYPWQVKPDGDHPQKKLRGESQPLMEFSVETQAFVPWRMLKS